METNEIKIEVPAGYEIDADNSNFGLGLIKFKLKPDKDKEMNDFLFDLFKKTTCEITGDKELAFYNKDMDWLIIQNWETNTLWVSYHRIWEIFESKFNLNNEDGKNR